MKKLSKVVATGLVAGMLMMSPAAVQAAEVTVGADVVSSYVWRGITLNKDVVVQPSVAVAHESGLALEVWANFDIGDDDGTYAKRQFSEVDFDLSYTLDLDVASITVGYIEYTFPGYGDVVIVDDEVVGMQASADREIYASIGAELLPGLGLDLTVYQNLATSDGTYAVLGAEYGLEVIEGLTLALNGSVGYGAKGATAGGKSGWHDYLVGLTAEMEVVEDVSVAAFINYVGSLDSDVLPSEAVREDVFGGVGVYYTF